MFPAEDWDRQARPIALLRTTEPPPAADRIDRHERQSGIEHLFGQQPREVGLAGACDAEDSHLLGNGLGREGDGGGDGQVLGSHFYSNQSWCQILMKSAIGSWLCMCSTNAMTAKAMISKASRRASVSRRSPATRRTTPNTSSCQVKRG